MTAAEGSSNTLNVITEEPSISVPAVQSKHKLPLVHDSSWPSRYRLWRRHVASIVMQANRRGFIAMASAWGARGGLTFMLKLLGTIWSSSRKLDKKDRQPLRPLLLLLRSMSTVECRDFGLFLGTFAFLWNFTYASLQLVVPEWSVRQRAALAGTVAGVSVFWQDRSQRIAFAQQLIVRVLQGFYNALESRGLVHVPHGDSLLFIWATAQIMYAFVVHPNTLQPDLYRFMLKSCNMPKVVGEEVSNHVRGLSVDVKRLSEHMGRAFPLAKHAHQYCLNELHQDVPVIPCTLVHPSSTRCWTYTPWLWQRVFRQIFAVYLPLNIVAMLLWKFKNLVKKPQQTLTRLMLSAGRSSVFFASLVAGYQLVVCLHRNLYHIPFLKMPHDHRFNYFVFGMIAALPIFIEPKARRGELALYALPKAMECFYGILMKRGVPRIRPGLEGVFFMLGLGGAMSLYESDPESLSPLLHKVLWYFSGRDPKPKLSSKEPAKEKSE